MKKTIEYIEIIFWKSVFAIAWVGCWIEDEIWTPIWWFFNKRKFERKGK